MRTELERISELVAQNPKMVFTSLYHLITIDLLRQCHQEMNGRKAVGVDSVTKDTYEAQLEENLSDLVARLKGKQYRPQPSLRVYIPKANGKKRPLGIAAYEDKLVQDALSRVLSAVFEPRFQKSMHGFRPNRNCHTALHELNELIERGKTNYIVDADIKGYFNAMEHRIILDLVKFRLADPNILWLLKKTLTAGVQEEGKWRATTRGSEQGNLASPIIANIYMHYALALWFDKRFKPTCRGECGLVVYADDFVATFQHKEEAERFLQAVKERFKDYGLELEPEKTRLIEFGRYARENRKKKGQGRPETFDFLGFTHYCSKSQKGSFRVKRKTSRKKMKMRLTEMNEWIRTNRHLPVRTIIAETNAKLRGHYQYYGITDNSKSIKTYYYRTLKALFKWLNRRSQKRSYTWEGLNDLLKVFPLIQPRIRVSIYG
ncbi:group II intron reverse transcriptase/maturase [Sporomusa sp.]|uniref:group II intron reverse transcriptase/maturase n=1 Tax=Sporomusa sp. TaxID=2078658 RepID=UPI002C7588FC|nr:group II intron reverse transcriptase/maturase [Sporomusa sp.]HWR08316.1 group II intron reverse transcriptase/maturase [Sporomusa sp.]